MIKNINKKICAVMLIIACIFSGGQSLTVSASVVSTTQPILVASNTQFGNYLDNSLVSSYIDVAEDMDLDVDTFIDYSGDEFISMDEEGNIVLIPSDEVETPDFSQMEGLTEIIEDPNGVASISTSSTYGVVVFNDMSNSNTYTSYTDAVTGAAGYTNGSYGPDAAYLGLSNGKVKFKISGVTGLCSIDDVTIYEYDDYVKQGYITSTYTTKNGKLYHNITTNLKSIVSTQLFGYQQSYMTDGATYYSYDGHYFYTSYKTMITDYKNGVYTNSINAKSPYYNYYMFLSHRTKTGFTATEFNTYISEKSGSTTSKMLNTGATFISAQNTYGSNAVLMLGLAINESGWGKSNIAQTKNNLFGHGAVDSNPYYGSTGYDTPADSITYHAQYFVSRQYLDAATDSRYYGAHLGNKESGMNVKYASDPYWGEKAAAHGFLLEEVSTATTVDYNNYQIGTVGGKTPIYNSPGGSILYYAKNYKLSNTYNIPVVILDTTTYNGATWYKIQSDMPVVSGRNSVIFSQIYNFTNDYAYVNASLVTLGNSVNDSSNTGSNYVLGDPSGDGLISVIDYVMVKNHITGVSTLTGDALLAADASLDGNISVVDYVMIKNHITGISYIN